jgi:DNA-binding SARP family transcriptional activator
VRFLVLGPPVVVGDHGGVPLGPPEQQALLVALVLNANRPLPAYRLIDGVWRHRTPSALTDLRVAVNGLHEALGAVDRTLAARLVQAGGGYLLRLNPEEADNLQFLHLLGQGKAALAADDFYAASHLFTEAMSLWRGAAGAGAAAHGWLRQQLDELEDLRTKTIQRVVEASLALDQPEPDTTGSTAPAATWSSKRVDPSRARASWSGGRPKSSRGKGRVASRAGR